MNFNILSATDIDKIKIPQKGKLNIYAENDALHIIVSNQKNIDYYRNHSLYMNTPFHVYQ